MGNQTFKNYKDISSRSSLHARSNTPAQLSALSVRPHAVRLRAAVPGSSPTHSPLPPPPLPCPFLPVSVKKKNIYIPIKLFIISCETCFHVTGAKMGFHVGNSDNIFHTTHNDDRRSFTTAQKLLQPLHSIKQ